MYNHTPAYASRIQLPQRWDKPTSGLNAQRFEPQLISRVGSYWPVGVTMVRLAPIKVFCRQDRNSSGVIAGPPLRLTEKRKTESRRPER